MNAANDFEKYIFKLIINYVYRKRWRIYEKKLVRDQ